MSSPFQENSFQNDAFQMVIDAIVVTVKASRIAYMAVRDQSAKLSARLSTAYMAIRNRSTKL